MKLALKLKLTISYLVLASFLSLSLLSVSKYFLENQFQVYVSHKQDMKNEEILGMVSRIFTNDDTVGYDTQLSFLSGFGDALLEQGILLMVYGADDDLIYCTNFTSGQSCNHVLGEGISDDEICPDFHGVYARKHYELTNEDEKFGSVLIGYHVPIVYDEDDRVFLDGFNRAFLSITLVFFTISLGAGLYMAARIATPIRRVTERTRRISEGEYAERVDITTGTTEIDELSASVDHLAGNLQTQLTLKKRMAHAYSHEFRTPFTTLQTNLEAIIDGIWAPTTERLESLLAEITRLSRMVIGIENLVQTRVNEPDNSDDQNKIPVDISEMTERILLNFEARIKQKNINLIHERSKCEAKVNPDKFSQVIFNLVSNAVKYTDRGGNIRVKTFESNDGKAVFSIEDNGIGISQSDLPFIFEYLYRTDESRTRDSEGNGIGLSVVKTVVEAHGGMVDVKSTTGTGSVFTVALPAAHCTIGR
jgi:signal transduction histidine kinase